jgi:23S rRNA (adenine2030-N6)-methyltransferase
MRSDPRIMIDQAGGLTAAVPLLPPRERRGLVFIDPSYEMKNDYTLVTETIIKMVKRFATGTYALWYPVVERRRNEGLERALKKSGIGNMQLFELGIQGDAEGFGMTACGMIIINPPWTLKAQMDSVLPWLARELGVNGAGHFRSEVLRD